MPKNDTEQNQSNKIQKYSSLLLTFNCMFYGRIK